MATTLYLDVFDTTMTMDACANITSLVGDSDVSASGTALLYVSLDAFKSMFKFHTDASDVDDLSANDVTFVVDASNLDSADRNLNPALAIVTEGHVNNVTTYDLSMVAMDFIRHIAFETFGTEKGVDLFSNEVALVEDLHTNGLDVHNHIKNAIASNNNRTLEINNDGKVEVDGSNNVAAKIFAHLLSVRAPTLSGESPYEFPFVANDELVYQLTVSPKGPVQGLVGNSVVPTDRTYKIVMRLVASGGDDNQDPDGFHTAFDEDTKWYNVNKSPV